MDIRRLKVVRLPSIRTGRLYPAGDILISVGGWVDPIAVVRLEGLCQWKIPMTPSTNCATAYPQNFRVVILNWVVIQLEGRVSSDPCCILPSLWIGRTLWSCTVVVFEISGREAISSATTVVISRWSVWVRWYEVHVTMFWSDASGDWRLLYGRKPRLIRCRTPWRQKPLKSFKLTTSVYPSVRWPVL